MYNGLINKQYSNELVRLKAKRAFIKNFNKHNKGGHYIAKLNELNSQKTFCEFIQTAFPWHETDEGSAYWETISLGRHTYKLK